MDGVCGPISTQSAVVYDLMEPLRPYVDRLGLSFIRSYTFTRDDFILGNNGVCRLHPQLARHMVELIASDIEIRDVVSAAVEKMRTVPSI